MIHIDYSFWVLDNTIWISDPFLNVLPFCVIPWCIVYIYNNEYLCIYYSSIVLKHNLNCSLTSNAFSKVLCYKQYIFWQILVTLLVSSNTSYWMNEFEFYVFNATFSNISAISWQPVLVVEEAGVPGENHQPWTSNW